MTMHCEFCSNKLRFSHHENGQKTIVYDCARCPILVSFYFQDSGERIKTAFMIDNEKGLYIWTNNYAKNCSYITDVGVVVSGKPRDPLLVKFPKIMDINPSNVMEKFNLFMVLL